MDKYEQLKKVIQEANPEIMELKFGCEVIVDGIREDNPGCEYDVVIDDRLKDGRVVLGYFGEVPLSQTKTIGRPIRLADVLLAIKKAKDDDAWKYAIDAEGRFMREWGEGRHETVLEKWNLRDDNLDHQSEETKQFLIDLLVE